MPNERGGMNEQHALDAERLASLIDGVLEDRERFALIERVAASGEDSDVLVDALAALGDLQADEPVSIASQSRVHRASRLPHDLAQWIAIAASIAVVAGISLVWMRRRAPSTPNPTQYAVSLIASGVTMPAGWNDTPWTAARGGGSSSLLSPDARAVRLGARLTDLEVAARSSDTSATRYALSIAALLDDVPAGAPVASIYRDIAARVGMMHGEESQSRLIASLDSAAAAARQLPDVRRMELGAWIEAARLAAASSDAEFFNGRESREMLKTLREPTAVDAGARADAAGVQSGLSVQSPDWTIITQRLTALLQRVGSTTR